MTAVGRDKHDRFQMNEWKRKRNQVDAEDQGSFLNRVLGRAEVALAVVCAGSVLRTIAVADRLLFARSSRYSSVSSILRSDHAKRIRPAFEEGAAASSGCYFVESWLLNNIKHSFVNDGCSRVPRYLQRPL